MKNEIKTKLEALQDIINHKSNALEELNQQKANLIGINDLLSIIYNNFLQGINEISDVANNAQLIKSLNELIENNNKMLIALLSTEFKLLVEVPDFLNEEKKE